MLKVGLIVHQARSGRLILRLSREVRPGASVFDAKGRKVGKIVELIGGVRAPYASVAVSSTKEGRPGDEAFVDK